MEKTSPFLGPMRKADMTLRLSEFEIPPMQDILLIGKKAPIGPEAVRRMVDALSPEQYDVIRVEHETFEAAVVRKGLLKMLPLEKLMPVVLEEGTRLATETMVIKAQVNVVIQVNREVDV